LDAKTIIVVALIAALVACFIAYGLWVRKGDREERAGK
jgi:hypothetical protein